MLDFRIDLVHDHVLNLGAQKIVLEQVLVKIIDVILLLRIYRRLFRGHLLNLLVVIRRALRGLPCWRALLSLPMQTRLHVLYLELLLIFLLDDHLTLVGSLHNLKRQFVVLLLLEVLHLLDLLVVILHILLFKRVGHLDVLHLLAEVVWLRLNVCGMFLGIL